MLRTQNYSAFVISLVVHAVILTALAMIQQKLQQDQPDIALETVFEEERVQEEFSQELEVDSEIAENMNVVSGGAVSTEVGGSESPAVAQQKIETSETLQEPDIEVNVSEISTPGLKMLGDDLGAGEVTGETGAVVSGYGEALGRITQELIRLMRKERVLAVWLFDESESMKDDQKEIRDKFHKVYTELGIAQEQDEEIRADKKILLTSILGFGKSIHELTPKPTAKINEIRAAIDKIGIDDSGKENMCQTIAAVCDKYRSMTQGGDRKLVIILVSDESGDDGQFVEETLAKAKRLDAPIYILGREAIFGYPYARIRWKDPVYGLNHWVQIDRGPETAFPEALQFDGLHKRWDSFSSGFGPYEQVRLAKETGGIFFVLPGEEENLTGAGAHLKRRFEFLDMKEYEPLLLSRREYEKRRNASKFRKTIWDVIARLNPHQDKQLNIKEHWYPVLPAKFQEEGKKQFDKAMRAMGLLSQAIQLLKNIEALRAEEASQRWRANYDLIMAQCMAYRVRLFQFMLALDRHSRNPPKPKKKKTNKWNVRRRKKMLEPTEEQIKITKVDTEVLQQQHDQAKELFQFVIEEHPGTPWAQRAKHELNQGFGMHFVEAFRDPRYKDVGDKIKVPNF